jgi:hypothetical protein
VRRRCPHCRAWTLAGHVDGVVVRVEVAPVASVAAEVRARIAGLDTYDRLRDGELVYRNDYRITRRELPVHAQHKCEVAE